MKILRILLALCVTQWINAQCFSELHSGNYHVIGKKSDGTFWGWGLNDVGQLNEPLSQMYVYSPTLIPNTTSYQKIIPCGFNTFGIKIDGTLWALGYNLYGVLGVGNPNDDTYTQFTQVGSANGWTEISSSYFTLALKSDGTIWGWGQNNFYQMGDGSCCNDRISPGQIGNESDWRSVAAVPIKTAFAIKNNGTLWGWGGNFAYLLGDSQVGSEQFPTQRSPDTDWDKMSVGYAHILVSKTDGTLWSWGDGGYGQTGDGLSPSLARYIPRKIGNENDWTDFSAGTSFSMGIRTNGTLWAWGLNDQGQLGDGGTTNQPLPEQIGTATNWQSVSCGYSSTVAIRSDNSVWTWGTNEYGQLGTGNGNPHSTPTNITVTGCALANEEFTAEPTLTLFPNPANDFLTLHYQGEPTDKVVIYDLQGRAVYQTETVGAPEFSATINVGQLARGNYILSVEKDGVKLLSAKWVKQ